MAAHRFSETLAARFPRALREDARTQLTRSGGAGRRSRLCRKDQSSTRRWCQEQLASIPGSARTEQAAPGAQGERDGCQATGSERRRTVREHVGKE